MAKMKVHELAKELNKMMESTNIDLIICAAGGEFLVEILPYVDFCFLYLYTF